MPWVSSPTGPLSLPLLRLWPSTCHSISVAVASVSLSTLSPPSTAKTGLVPSVACRTGFWDAFIHTVYRNNVECHWHSAWCGQVGNRCSTDCQMMSSSSSCSSAGTTSYTQKNNNNSSSNRPLVLGLSITFSILGAAIIATVVVVAVVVIRRRRAAAAATPNGQLDQQLLDTQYVAQRNAL